MRRPWWILFRISKWIMTQKNSNRRQGILLVTLSSTDLTRESVTETCGRRRWRWKSRTWEQTALLWAAQQWLSFHHPSCHGDLNDYWIRGMKLKLPLWLPETQSLQWKQQRCEVLRPQIDTSRWWDLRSRFGHCNPGHSEFHKPLFSIVRYPHQSHYKKLYTII